MLRVNLWFDVVLLWVPYSVKEVKEVYGAYLFTTPYSNVISDNTMSRLVLTWTKQVLIINFHIFIHKIEKKFCIEPKFLKGPLFATQGLL